LASIRKPIGFVAFLGGGAAGTIAIGLDAEEDEEEAAVAVTRQLRP
jgi:hypothetical protein